MNKITSIHYDVLGDKVLVAFFRQNDKDYPRCYYATDKSAYRLIWTLRDKYIQVKPSRNGWYVAL